MKFLQERLLLSDKGYSDLKSDFCLHIDKPVHYAFICDSNSVVRPALKPFMGQEISWSTMWVLLVIGVLATILVFIAAKNDYKKTYLASYKEASNTRLRIAEHLRRLPMSFLTQKTCQI